MNFYFNYYMVGGGIYGKMSSYCLSARPNNRCSKKSKKKKGKIVLQLLFRVWILLRSRGGGCPHLSSYYYAKQCF